MARGQRECSRCGATFKSATDWAVHVTVEHRNEPPPRRTWSCWRCSERNPGEADTCQCGFSHPGRR